MAAPLKKSRNTDSQPDKGGRPSFDPDAEQRKTVNAMAGYGIPQDDIARVIGVDPKTLRKHFRNELDTGETIATAKVAESLYKQATGGNVAAAIFWMKARAGWSERIINEHGGPNGEALNFTVNFVAPEK